MGQFHGCSSFFFALDIFFSGPSFKKTDHAGVIRALKMFLLDRKTIPAPDGRP